MQYIHRLDGKKTIYPWPTSLYDFIQQIWKAQGKTNQRNCTGMSSFSFWLERIMYDASNDELVRG